MSVEHDRCSILMTDQIVHGGRPRRKAFVISVCMMDGSEHISVSEHMMGFERLFPTTPWGFT